MEAAKPEIVTVVGKTPRGGPPPDDCGKGGIATGGHDFLAIELFPRR